MNRCAVLSPFISRSLIELQQSSNSEWTSVIDSVQSQTWTVLNKILLETNKHSHSVLCSDRDAVPVELFKVLHKCTESHKQEAWSLNGIWGNWTFKQEVWRFEHQHTHLLTTTKLALNISAAVRVNNREPNEWVSFTLTLWISNWSFSSTCFNTSTWIPDRLMAERNRNVELTWWGWFWSG